MRRRLSALSLPPLVIVIALGALLLPRARYYEDDYIQIGTVEGWVSIHGSAPFDLYRFVDGTPAGNRRAMDVGPLPWFSAPDLKLHFFRPLPSALITLDHALWGRRAAGYQLSTLIWFLAAVLLTGCVARRLFPGPRPAPVLGVLAAVVFALNGSYWFVVGYSAARWMVVATVLGLAGTLAHLRWRQDGWRPGSLLAPVLFGAGCLGGEVIVGMFGYLVAYELIAAPGGRIRRLAALTPVTAVILAYLVGYRFLGFGSGGTDHYTNPLSSPLGFLADAPGHMAALLAELTVGVPSMSLAVPGQGARAAVLALAGLSLPVLLILPTAGTRPGARRRLALVLAGTALSLLPLTAPTPQTRLLMPGGVGIAILVSAACDAGWADLRGRRGAARWGAGVLLVTLLVLHGAVAPSRWVGSSGASSAYADAREREIRNREWVEPGEPDTRAVFLTPHIPDGMHGIYIRRFLGLPAPTRYWMLSAAAAAHRYRRTSVNTLELELTGGRMMDTSVERALRGRHRPLAAGQRLTLDGLVIEILERDRVGPTRVRFRFDRPLDDPSIRLLGTMGGELRHLPPPAVGGALDLPSPW